MTSPGLTEGVGERKLVTMLFADLSGYTALAETMDAEDVFALVGPTMRELQAVVESYGGTVPLIQGDGFMAVFGVPTAHEDDAERAVRAALAVRDRVRELNRDREGRRVPEVHAGVNSGEVMVAPSSEPAGFTVIGDTVNTASRIGGLATAGHVLVSEETHRLTGGVIRYGPPRRRRVKGKSQPLLTFEALEGIPRGPGSRPGGTFVDREEILGVLGRELETAERTRRARVMLVTGEPGIGKSRLALELGHSLSPGRFLSGRCSPFGDRPPLAALGDAVAVALGVAGATPEVTRVAIDQKARMLAPGAAPALAADLRTLLGVEVGEAARSEPDTARAARLVIEDVARDEAVALVLDDLHWADASLLGWLGEVHRDPWHTPLLVLGISREPVPDLPVTRLTELDRASMRALADGLLGEGASADAVRVPVARANGNALFLEEMVGMLLEAGAIRHERGRWRLADPDAVTDVPASIRLLIAARLDALPEDRKRLLRDAAVGGMTTWDALLEGMGDGADPRDAVLDLVARDILRPRPHSSVLGAREYEWKHALVRDVAYEAIPRSARGARHVQVAGWLRETATKGREPLGAIAYHYERAWELSRRGPGSEEVAALAAEYLTRSAEQMFGRQARAAEPLFRRALRAAEAAAGDDPCPLARAAVGLAEVLIEMGAHDEAIQQASRARLLADDAGDGKLAARALLALGRSESDVGRMRRARTLLVDAKVRFETEGDLRGQAWAVHRLSETRGWEGLESQLDDLRESYRLFTRARDRFGRAVVAHDLAYILSVEGGAEFRRWYAQAERLADDDGDLRSRALLARTWGHFCYSAGRFAEAAETMAGCRPLAVEAGERYAEADALVIGALAGVQADPVGAKRLADEAIVLGKELGSLRTPALARLAIARASIRTGHLDRSTRALRAARDAVRSRRVRVMYGDMAEAEAMVALDRGAWDRAHAHARSLASALDAIPMALWKPLPALITGRALLGAGRSREALRPLGEAVQGARSVGAGGTLALARACEAQAAVMSSPRVGRAPRPPDTDAEIEVAAVSAETAGLAALRRGELTAAVDALDRAVGLWERGGSTSWLARALALRSEALRANGDRARAAASKGRADSVAVEIRMPARERASLEDLVRSAQSFAH